MSTQNKTLAFRPRPELLAAVEARQASEEWSTYALLNRAVELFVWPDREPSPVVPRAPAKEKAAAAPKKAPKAAKPPKAVAAPKETAPAPPPKQSAFRQALAGVSDGPVPVKPGSRLKPTKGKK